MAIDSVSVANMPYWNVLPMGVTNFGGDTQVFTVDNYSTGQIGCTLNPMGLAAVNGYGQPGLYNNWGFTPSQNNPFMDGMNRNAEQISAGLAKQSIHTSLQTIAIAKQRLNAMLMQPGFEKQQKKIEKLLEKLDKQEEKLNDLLSETELTPAETLKKARAIENDVRKIIADIAKIKPGSSSSVDGKDDGDGEDGGDDVEPAEDKNEDGIGDYPTYSDEALIMADQFQKAVYYRWGTDDKLFNQVCESINQDNVIDVMLAYQDNHTLRDNESFMTAFFKDADNKQGIVYGRKIANALRLEARELGVYQQCREDFNAIFEELDDADGWLCNWDVDNDIAKHYDNIIKIIAEKKGQPYDTSEFKY